MVSSRDFQPKCQAANLHSGNEGREVLCITGGDSPPPLEMQKGVLDQMSQFVERLVVFPRVLTILARRNHHPCSLFFGLRHDRVAVVAFIGKQVFHAESVNQPVSFRAICSGTFRNNNSERHTMRIHGQVYLGVEPPFVRLIP